MTRQPRERVERPNGRTWTYSPGGGRPVRSEPTPAGPALVVARTHDLELARGLVADRWIGTHRDAAMPEGRRAWRRPHFDDFAGYRRTSMTHAVAVGDEHTAYPVVVFDPPSSSKETAA